jgi:benzoate 4-monooxygenase
MLKAATDVLPLFKPQSDAAVVGGAKVEYFPILKVVHERDYYVGSLGVLLTWVWPVLKRVRPWYRTGGVAAANFAKLATTDVYQRLETPTDRVDIISKLIEGKDDEGTPRTRW